MRRWPTRPTSSWARASPARWTSCASAAARWPSRKTTIEELYAWEFNGPFLRDFCGNQPVGKRDAGAIEYVGEATLSNP